VSPVARVDPLRPEASADAVDDAVHAIADGGLVVLPTETVYGIACRPDDASATARLFEAKARPRGLNLAVLAATAAEALALTRPTPHANALSVLWPGPLTMVLPRADRARGWSLGEGAATIGVRVPALPLATALLARTGPLAVTSANRSGEAPAATAPELLAAFGDAVAVYLTVEEAAGGSEPSTVLDLTHPPRVRLVRAGPFGRDRIAAILRDSGPDPEWVDFPP
jgi:tRNA threonylcarbamoyl adenosine modification protein (Sua5/YciO/YrdC/YwlC family)